MIAIPSGILPTAGAALSFLPAAGVLGLALLLSVLILACMADRGDSGRPPMRG